MDLLTWGRSPWSQDILTHISWNLLYAAAAAGVLFMLVSRTSGSRHNLLAVVDRDRA